MEKPEALTTSGLSEVYKYNVFKNSHLQPTDDGQLTPAESGQDQLRQVLATELLLILVLYFLRICSRLFLLEFGSFSYLSCSLDLIDLIISTASKSLSFFILCIC